MSQVITKPVEANENGFKPFYWGSSVSVQRKDGGTLTVEEALAAGGLDFTVDKYPLGAYTPREGGKPTFTRGEDMFVTARNDTGAILGPVGKRYQTYQFADGARFVSDIIDSGEAVIEVVGQSDNGATGWIVCRLLGTGMSIGGVDENITPYLTIIMNHTGNQSVTVVVSPVRPPCANLLNFTVKEASNVFRVRHTETMKDKLTIQSGRDALGLTIEYMGAFEREMAKLLERKVTPKQVDNLLHKIAPVPGGETSMTYTDKKSGEVVTVPMKNRGVKVASEKQDAIRAIYNNDGNLDNVRGTRYGLLQAVVEHYQHETQGRNTLGDGASKAEQERALSEQRTTRLLMGTGLGQTAWNVLTAK